MAVDTKDKRFSMLNLGRGSSRLLMDPDGTVDDPDKQHLVGLYSGIAFDDGLPDPPSETIAGGRRMSAVMAGGAG